MNRWPRLLFLIISLSVTAACLPRAAHAQDANPAAGPGPAPADLADAGAANAEKPEGSQESLADMILKGGWVGGIFYGLLVIFSLVGTTVAIQQLLNLRRSKVAPVDIVSRLEDIHRRNEGSAEAYASLCRGREEPIAQILEAGVLRAGRSLPEVEKSMEDAAARELSSLKSRNRPISVIGGVAPLVGLMGTVVGMIMAFKTTASLGVGDRGEKLAEGIYLALLTTAAGLAVAIPSLLLVPWFSAKAERLMRDIDLALAPTVSNLAAPTVQVTKAEVVDRTAAGAGASSTTNGNDNAQATAEQEPAEGQG